MVEHSEGDFTNFICIAPSTWVYAPPNPYHLRCPLSKQAAAPSLVLLCSWTEAQLRHIAAYTAVYQCLFPFTRIMVITTSIKDLCFHSSRRKRAHLGPAVKQIRSYQRFDFVENRGTILMHIFSEGGSHKACELAEAYYTTTATRLPVSALFLDSTPGCPRYSRLCKAINTALPTTPLLRHTGLFLSGTLVGCIWVFYCTIKDFDENTISRTRRRILDPTYRDLSTPRRYLYSKTDALVFWRDVEDHVHESILKNIPVVLWATSGTFVGTPMWSSPEAIMEMPWNTATDIWSFGTLLISLIYGGDFNLFLPKVDRDHEEYQLGVLMQQYRYFGPFPAKIADIVSDETAQSIMWIMQEIPREKLTPFCWTTEREVNKRDKDFICKIMKLDWRDRLTAKELLGDEWWDDD